MSYTIKTYVRQFKNCLGEYKDPGIKYILPLPITNYQNDNARYQKNTISWDQNVNTFKKLTEFTIACITNEVQSYIPYFGLFQFSVI